MGVAGSPPDGPRPDGPPPDGVPPDGPPPGGMQQSAYELDGAYVLDSGADLLSGITVTASDEDMSGIYASNGGHADADRC